MPYGYLLKYSPFHRLQMVSLIFLLANTTPMSRLLRLLDLALSGPFGERWLPHGLDKLDHGLLEFSPFQGRCCICFQLSAPLRRLVPATTNVVPYVFCLPWVALRSPAAVLFHRDAVLFCRQLRSLWSLTSGYEWSRPTGGSGMYLAFSFQL